MREGLRISVPKIGDKRKLVELSYRSMPKPATRGSSTQNEQARARVDNHWRLMEQMQKDLRLKNKPTHIECFDNSNIQGNNPVAACVVFKNGKPSKKEYRHFNIKTVVGPGFWLYGRGGTQKVSKAGRGRYELPQLIVIDGGKGQLSSAVKSLERLGLMGEIAIIGIAKKLEEIYFPGDSVPLDDKR